jgi:hypothetical protein
VSDGIDTGVSARVGTDGERGPRVSAPPNMPLAVTIPAISTGLTFAIAVIGAVTGTVSAAVAAIGAYRGRQRLRLTAVDCASAEGREPWVFVDVLNDGPRGTTVRKVGLWAKTIAIQAEGGARTTAVLSYDLKQEPFFLEAGETEHFELGAGHDWLLAVPLDQPLRAYAVDARERKVWGRALPVLRIFLQYGWQPPPKWSPQVQSPQERLLPERVEPRWKLWKRRELRNPKAYSWPR